MRTQLKITALGMTLMAVPVLTAAQTTQSIDASAIARAEARRHPASAGGETALQATIEADLPEAPVRRAIAEGEAKGASADRIDRATMGIHARLMLARQSLSGGERRRRPSDAEIVAGADALAAGAGARDLQRLRDAAPEDGSLAASLTALATLRSGGAAGSEAVDAARASAAGALDASGSLSGAVRGAGATLGAGLGARGSLGGVLDR